ncbi:MAG: hypothetical protein ACREFO_20330, partial [Acetobacteraceae bacterium]
VRKELARAWGSPQGVVAAGGAGDNAAGAIGAALGAARLGRIAAGDGTAAEICPATRSRRGTRVRSGGDARAAPRPLTAHLP